MLSSFVYPIHRGLPAAVLWFGARGHTFQREPDLAHGTRTIVLQNDGFLEGCGGIADVIETENPARSGQSMSDAPDFGQGERDRGPILERVYDWPLVVTRDPAVGAPALVPLRVRPRGERSVPSPEPLHPE
jgi:hypothetical protein